MATKTEKIVYKNDASCEEGTVLDVYHPESTKEVEKIIKDANKKNISVTPRGGGTSLTGSSVPKNSAVLDVSKMNKILDFTNDFVKVEAGLTVDELNEFLKTKNKFFPVIPASHSACQIGGMISTNAAGLRAIKYGNMADWTIEVELIDGNGKKRILKNPEEFAGTEGLIGIITIAKLKITKPIGKTTMSVFEFLDSEKLVEKAEELKKEKGLIALEYVSRLISEKLGFSEKDHLIAEFDNEKGRIKELEEMKKIWKVREHAGPILIKGGLPTLEDPKVSKEKMAEFLDWLIENNIPAFGHIGYGIIHPHFKEKSPKIEKMFEYVLSISGEVTGEHGIGLSKKRYTPLEKKKRLEKLKKKFDKNNIMNRGKVI